MKRNSQILNQNLWVQYRPRSLKIFFQNIFTNFELLSSIYRWTLILFSFRRYLCLCTFNLGFFSLDGTLKIVGLSLYVRAMGISNSPWVPGTYFKQIMLSSQNNRTISMLRNPFTSVTNLSFLRNSSNVSKSTRDNFRPRSLSGSKHFDAITPFIYDRQMMAHDNRRQKQNQYLQAVGYEAYRYAPDTYDSDYNCYYSLSKYEQLPKPVQREEKISRNAEQSTEYQSNGLRSNMKNTKDMFSSDYFSNIAESAGNQQPLPRKGSILRKETNGSSCVKVKKNIELNCSRLSEQPSKFIDSQNGNDQSYSICLKQPDPKTIYLNSKKKIFYLYQSEIVNI